MLNNLAKMFTLAIITSCFYIKQIYSYGTIHIHDV